MRAPGSGKGTQAALLVEQLNLPHISTGALLRDAIKRGYRSRAGCSRNQRAPHLGGHRPR